MTDVTQENRSIQVETPLGKDVLLLGGFQFQERVSAPFQGTLDLLSDKDDISFDEIVGKPVGITVASLPGERYFHGIVRSFRQKETEAGLYTYEAEIVPWLWLLSLTTDCRVFPGESVPDIIKKIFDENGMSDYDVSGLGTYTPRTYCVQYRESDFDFVSRLMEEEGIHYFFTHEQGKHVMVLGDSPSANKPCESQSEVKYFFQPGGTATEEVMTRFTKEARLGPDKVRLKDYNWEDPLTDIFGEKQGSGNAWEIYDYPGGFTDKNEGTSYAQIRMEALDAAKTIFTGDSIVRSLMAGGTMEVSKHPREDHNATFLITSVTHWASAKGSYIAGDAGFQDDEAAYENTIEAIPHEVPYRPARVTPRPLIKGVQTAMVVGPEGEEIVTDEFGRIPIQFHWDRLAKRDGEKVCWVRVAHGSAGKNWGALFIPRVGHEVLVEFLEGNPDHPVVTGCLYHAEAMPPLPLPDEKTRSGIKTRSTPEGDTTAFNQIRFEDQKGEEQVYIQAEKDADTRVKNDSAEWVGNDAHRIVVNDDHEHVQNDRHQTVDNLRIIKVGGDDHLAVEGEQAIEVTGQHSFSVTGDVVEVFGSNHSEETSGDLYLKAAGIVIEADSGITLKVGGSSVVIDSSGVTVTGSTVTVDGSMTKINSGPGSSASAGSAGSATMPEQPAEALEADESNEADNAAIGPIGEEGSSGSSESVSAAALSGGAAGAAAAAASAGDDEEQLDTHWVSFELKDEESSVIANEPYVLKLPDGTEKQGRTDDNGFVKIEGIAEPGECEINLPRISGDEWYTV